MVDKPKLKWLLTGLFFFAMVMGAGPGVYLVNGSGPLLGMPAIYTWALIWFLVQASIVVIAFNTIWKR